MPSPWCGSWGMANCSGFWYSKELGIPLPPWSSIKDILVYLWEGPNLAVMLGAIFIETIGTLSGDIDHCKTVFYLASGYFAILLSGVARF